LQPATVTLLIANAIVGCTSRKDGTAVESVRGAVTAALVPGQAGGVCGFVEQLSNGDVQFAVKFPTAQAFVEVFSQRNGTQNIAQAMPGFHNADGSFTYRFTAPASTYHAGDQIRTRFYSYAPSQPGVFTPGPTDATFLPTFAYGSATCAENIACTAAATDPTFVRQLANGNLQFNVTLPGKQQFVEVFVQQNRVQNIATNIVSSGVGNPDGSFTYSLVAGAANYKTGDQILARFYSFKASSPGVFTPGPLENVWAPLLVYNATNGACGSGPSDFGGAVSTPAQKTCFQAAVAQFAPQLGGDRYTVLVNGTDRAGATLCQIDLYDYATSTLLRANVDMTTSIVTKTQVVAGTRPDVGPGEVSEARSLAEVGALAAKIAATPGIQTNPLMGHGILNFTNNSPTCGVHRCIELGYTTLGTISGTAPAAEPATEVFGFTNGVLAAVSIVDLTALNVVHTEVF
jgi:hypothetical protein